MHSRANDEQLSERELGRQSTSNEDKQTKQLPFGLSEDVLFKTIFPFVNPNMDCFIENTRALVTLSGTCSSMYHFFKPELDKRLNHFTLHALTCVLQGNEEVAIKLAKSHPQIFFIKSTTYDYAMDLESNRRILEDWSPYQAMFGTGDVDMLKKVKPYLDAYLATLSEGQKFACDQVQEKFPNGFEYPESTYNFDPLVYAIKHDQQLRSTGKPSDATLTVLTAFRADFKPGVIKTGHHFNLNDFVKVLTVCNKNWKEWSGHQLWFFDVYVIGFLQRLLPAPYMYQACRDTRKQEQSLNRTYSIISRLYNLITMEIEEDKQIVVFPLDTDVTCRLGDGFFVSFLEGGVGFNYWPNPQALRYKGLLYGRWESYVKQIENDLKATHEPGDVATKENTQVDDVATQENTQDRINFRTLGLFSVGAAMIGTACIAGMKILDSYHKEIPKKMF